MMQCGWLVSILFFLAVTCQASPGDDSAIIEGPKLLRSLRSGSVFLGSNGRRKHSSSDCDEDSGGGPADLDDVQQYIMSMGRRSEERLTPTSEEIALIDEELPLYKRARSKGFLGMRGKKEPNGPLTSRFANADSAFFAMRGKRADNKGRKESTFFGLRGKKSLCKDRITSV